ncbi:MAG: TonB-dependent receptor [Paludibacter sp.]|nr:TonB-dependent receptor [Paludibacter sp.]
MKKALTIFIAITITLSVQAQKTDSVKVIQLQDVEVKGASIIHKVDRMLIIPTKTALKNAYNPFDLMFNMAIPHLNVNPVSKDIMANGGGVQLRINHIKATINEVAALLPKDIIRIEMIENPGERYGDNNLGAVLDIIVRHRDTGGLINMQTTNSPNVLFGDNAVALKYNQGKSQWGLNYGLGYRGVKQNRTDKTETFYLPNETINRIQEGINDRNSWTDQNIDLSYNYSNSEKYTFNAVLRNSIHSAPHQDASNKIFNLSNTDNYIMSKLRSSSSSYSPALDLYFQHILPKQQTLTLNLTGTLINTNNKRSYEETTINGVSITDITSNVDGKKSSIIGEAIYDKKFEKNVLSAGIRYYQMKAENKYVGTNPITADMFQNRSSAFVELQGRLKTLSYDVSAGLTRFYFEEGGQSHVYYTISPTVKLAFSPHKDGYISYRFNTDPQMPSLSSLTNVEQAIDSIQIIRGNPLLKTYNVFNNNLNYSFSKNSMIVMFNVNHSYRDNCIMESVFAEGNKLIIMEENQKSYQSLEIYPAIVFRGLTVFGLKNFLTLSTEGGFTRYWSNGKTYTHTYNNFFYNAQFMLNYNEFALLGQFSKNKNILMGETIFKGENQTALMATWTHKRLQLGLGMLFPFTNNYKTGIERLSNIAPYTAWTYTKEAGQMVAIRINYNFEFGHQSAAKEKRMSNSDKDAGIIKFDK